MRLGRLALGLMAATVLILGQSIPLAFAESENSSNSNSNSNGGEEEPNGKALGHEHAPGLLDEATVDAEVAAAVESTVEDAAPSDQECDGDPTGHSDSGNGANQGGYYDHKCDGDESHNGNGGGNATGRPCEGCVGQADDKNPGQNNGKGQMPDESDHNKGYECDENNGIGKGNPAHTGCETHTSTPTPPPSIPPGDTPPTTPPSTPPGETPVQVLGVKVVADTTQVAGAALPRTGIDAIPAMTVSLALIGAGLALLFYSRRKDEIASQLFRARAGSGYLP